LGRVFSLLGLLLAVACAAPAMETPQPSSQEVRAEAYRQRMNYVRTLFGEQERLARIGYRLSVGVVDLCGDRATFTTGAFFFDWDQTKDDWVDAANEALGVNLHSPGIEVLIVVPGSRADKAGLRFGDRVVRVDDWRVRAGRGAFAEFRGRIDASLAQGSGVIDFRIQRGTEFLTIKLAPTRACDYPVLVADNQEINAYTDGRKIVVSRGMLRFARDDDELAVVVAHEMAHIVLGHVDAKRQNALAGAAVGAVFDVLIAAATGVYASPGIGRSVGANVGALAYSKDFEAEADYMGAYMVAQAGYDFTKTAELHRYMSTVDRDSMDYGMTHPSSPQRAISLDKTVQEIREKKAAGRPLVPGNGTREDQG